MLLIKQKTTSLNRDKDRFEATFNYSRVTLYLVPANDAPALLHVREKDKVSLLRKHPTDSQQALSTEKKPVFLPRALASMFHAPIFSSAERPPQPQSSQFIPSRSAWGAVLWDTSRQRQPSLGSQKLTRSPQTLKLLPLKLQYFLTYLPKYMSLL